MKPIPCSLKKKISKIDKSLSGTIKKNAEKAPITNIRNEKGIIIINPELIKGIVKEHYKQLYTHKFNNVNCQTPSLPLP